MRAICLGNSEGVWSSIVQYMPTETYFLSISFSSDHIEFCFFFPPYAQSLTFAFFISLFRLFLFIPIFLALSSHHFILGTLYVSHFIFHKWQEQYVWYTTTYMFFIMKFWYLDSSSTEKLDLLSLFLNLNKPVWQPQQVKYKESDAIWFSRIDPKSARRIHLAFLGYLLLKSCYKKIQALQGESHNERNRPLANKPSWASRQRACTNFSSHVSVVSSKWILQCQD